MHQQPVILQGKYYVVYRQTGEEVLQGVRGQGQYRGGTRRSDGSRYGHRTRRSSGQVNAELPAGGGVDGRGAQGGGAAGAERHSTVLAHD